MKKKLINSYVYVYLIVLENVDIRGFFYFNWFCFLFKFYNVFFKIKKIGKIFCYMYGVIWG